MSPKQLLRVATLLLLATTALAAAPALAQERPRLPNQLRSGQPPDAPALGRATGNDEPNPNVTVQDRARPEYDPIGLRAGSFFIYPQVTLGGFYDDNVFATDDDEEGDFAATVQPRVLVQSNFSRHQILLDVGGDITTYAEEDDLNYQDAYARAAGRLDITRNDILSGSVGINKLHEDPSSPDREEGGDDEVTDYLRDDVDLAYRRNFNRLYAVVGGGLTRLDFEDTDDTNEDDRDRNQYLGRVRAGYEISPRLGAFAQATYDVRRYDQTPDDEGLDRDSDGVGFRVGAEVDITSIIFGEVGVGYTYRQYDDDELDSVDGVGFGGALTWNVTPLTSIVLNAQGDIQETTVGEEGSDDRASANFQKLLTVDVTHELLRNVLLNANAGYIRDDFEGIDRSDDTFVVGGGVSYLLNRNLSLDATYDFSTRSSDENDEEYTRNIILVGVTARL